MGERKPVEDLRRKEFLKKAADAYDQMFGIEHQEQLITFTQREERAVEVSRKLGLELLEKHVRADMEAAPADKGETACCPKCHQTATLLAPEETRNGSPPERKLKTLTGEIQFSRAQYYCPKCRAAFFPSGSQTSAGQRRLQSMRASKDSETRRKSSFVQRSQ